jgi:hypothetical protein
VHDVGNQTCEIDVGRSTWQHEASDKEECRVIWLANARLGIRGEWGSKEADNIEQHAKVDPWLFWCSLRSSSHIVQMADDFLLKSRMKANFWGVHSRLFLYDYNALAHAKHVDACETTLQKNHMVKKMVAAGVASRAAAGGASLAEGYTALQSTEARWVGSKSAVISPDPYIH